MMKLSDLEKVKNLYNKLRENASNLRAVKDGGFSVTVEGSVVSASSYVLKERITRELTAYYEAERNLFWNELKILGVEVDV